MQLSKKIILASTSAPRRAVMEQLGVPFTILRPSMDESPLRDELPIDMVRRLSIGKAQSIASSITDPACVIGSDQVAICDGQVFGKPHNAENAARQLEQVSGKKIVFYTGLALIDVPSGRIQADIVPCTVHFRNLSRSMIDNYIRLEQPFQCAGSFKSERLGVALIDKLECDDPNSLIGLPLIHLVRMLENENVRLI